MNICAMLKYEVYLYTYVLYMKCIQGISIEYKTKGEVHGYLLNQFSMDEHEENLRVATTTYVYTRRDNTMYNNVYVLNKDLEQKEQIVFPIYTWAY